MQVIITLAGLGQRFSKSAEQIPKPLAVVMGKPAIYFLINMMDPSWELFFAIGEHWKNTELEKEIKKIRPAANIVYVPYSLRGPLDTVLNVLPHLNSTRPVAVSYSDYAMLWNTHKFSEFLKTTDCDVCMTSYRGFHATYLGPNTYAHLQTDEKTNKIAEIQEKKLFGVDIENEWSSTGFHYFKTIEILKMGLSSQVQKNLKYDTEYYTSLAVQALIHEKAVNLKILNYEISHMMQMGTPQDIQQLNYWFRYIKTKSQPNNFLTDSQEYKLYNYWKYIFENIK